MVEEMIAARIPTPGHYLVDSIAWWIFFRSSVAAPEPKNHFKLSIRWCIRPVLWGPVLIHVKLGADSDAKPALLVLASYPRFSG